MDASEQPAEPHTNTQLLDMPVAALGQALRDGSLSPVELAKAALQRIQAVDERVRAFVTVTSERALEDARRAEQELRTGTDRGPLHGIPLALKDLVLTRGIKTTASSRVLEDYVPDYDAAIVERLRAAGVVLVGKTNTHEFAYGTFTPPTGNPWDVARVPGGSSGGSAAALAARMCLLAIGTDTGGSIRIPAACCGVTGFKPTYGLVSCYGIIPLSWSLDHAGPLARSVEECALLLDVLVGHDSRDPASLAAAASPPVYAAALQPIQPELFPLTGIRIGVPEGSYFEAVEPEIAGAVSVAVRALEGLGAQVEGVLLPEELAGLFQAYRGVQMPEATVAHQEAGWWPTRADAYTSITRDRLKMGEHMPATDTARAQRVRAAFARGMRAVMERVDLLALPTLPILPPRREALAQPVQLGGKDFDAGAALLRLTFPFNMTGQPALSLPCGFSTTGLPIGLQLVARHLDEATLLCAGHAYQQATDWHLRQPVL